MEVSTETSSVDMLQRFAPEGSTVYGVVRSVARSGLSRTIDFYAIHDGQMMYLSGYLANVLGYSRTKEGALRVRGGGMDMCFHVVYSAARAVYGDGYALKSETL